MPLFSKSKQVAIYTRVSTDEQKTDLQLMDLKEYVAKRDYEIYNFYEDIVSGATKERKALDQLFQDANRRKFVKCWEFQNRLCMRTLDKDPGLVSMRQNSFLSARETW